MSLKDAALRAEFERAWRSDGGRTVHAHRYGVAGAGRGAAFRTKRILHFHHLLETVGTNSLFCMRDGALQGRGRRRTVAQPVDFGSTAASFATTSCPKRNSRTRPKRTSSAPSARRRYLPIVKNDGPLAGGFTAWATIQSDFAPGRRNIVEISALSV